MHDTGREMEGRRKMGWQRERETEMMILHVFVILQSLCVVFFLSFSVSSRGAC